MADDNISQHTTSSAGRKAGKRVRRGAGVEEVAGSVPRRRKSKSKSPRRDRGASDNSGSALFVGSTTDYASTTAASGSSKTPKPRSRASEQRGGGSAAPQPSGLSVPKPKHARKLSDVQGQGGIDPDDEYEPSHGVQDAPVRRRYDYVVVFPGEIRDVLLSKEPVSKPTEADVEAWEAWEAPADDPDAEKPEDPEVFFTRITEGRKILRQLAMAGLETLLLESESHNSTYLFITISKSVLFAAAERMQTGLRVSLKNKKNAIENNKTAFPVTQNEGDTFPMRFNLHLDLARPPVVLDVEVSPRDTMVDVKRRLAKRNKYCQPHRLQLRCRSVEAQNPFTTVSEQGWTPDSVVDVNLHPAKTARPFLRRQFHAEDEDELRYDYNWDGFTQAEKLNVIKYKIRSPLARDDFGRVPTLPDGRLDLARLTTGGAALDLNRALTEKVVSAFFPLHEPRARQQLDDEWIGWKNVLKPQPIEKIRAYFGEKIGLYFLYLGFYTQWLAIPALMGLIVFSVQQATSVDHWIVIPYAMFVVVWATFFLEFWKRTEAAKRYEWDTSSFAEREPDRPAFIEAMNKQFRKIRVVGIPVAVMRANATYYFPPNARRWRVALSSLATISAVAVVFTAIVGVVFFRKVLESSQGFFGTNARAFAGFVTGASIVIFNIIYTKAAVKLNDWENYRTDSAYEDNLIVKVFSFQFANSFASLFYIAFGEERLDPESTSDAERSPEGVQLNKLSTQLLSILTVSQVVNAAKEMLLPVIKARIKNRKLIAAEAAAQAERERLVAEGKDPDVEMGAAAKAALNKQTGNSVMQRKRALASAAHEDLLDQGEAEYVMPQSEGTFEEYAEMMLQFGYSTMFVTAFPLAPVLAFVNNIAEIRLDGLKFIRNLRRPEADRDDNIGIWLTVLQFMSMMAVLTNVGVIFITSRQFLNLQLPYVTPERVTDPSQCPFGVSLNAEGFCELCDPAKLCGTAKIWWMFVIEHALIAAKLFVRAAIPDEPDWIKESQFQTELFENRRKADESHQLEKLKDE